MAVTKALGVLVLLVACGDPDSRRSNYDARVIDVPPGPMADAYVWPDAAPPVLDAPPPPALACSPESDAAMQCELPPSVCIDSLYLAYYTGGTCVDNQCEFETHWLYCNLGCIPMLTSGGAGCSPGFT